MRNPPDRERQIDKTLLLGLFILLLFTTPMLAWWGNPDSPWYQPYLLWLGIILIIAWVHRRGRHEP